MVLIDFLKVEQIKAMYTQITPSLLVTIIFVYTIAFIVLWPVYDKTLLLIWYISGIVISVSRKLSAMNFQKTNITPDNIQSWITKAVVWAFLSGISWSFIFVFFSSPDHYYRLLILLGVYGALITGDTAKDRTIMAEKAKLPLLHKPVNSDRLRNVIDDLLDIK